ncbi:MAG: hypothetical protein ACRDJC_19890 [Thermomicrobiales bacterium]
MNDNRTDSLPRMMLRARSRRGTLLRAGVALLGLAVAPELGHAKQGKRKRRCKNKNQPEPVPTCEERCFPDFPFCFERTEGAPLCANGAETGGTVPCATDQECLGDPSKPYCLVSLTNRDTGDTDRFPTCEPYAAGCCISAAVI